MSHLLGKGFFPTSTGTGLVSHHHRQWVRFVCVWSVCEFGPVVKTCEKQSHFSSLKAVLFSNLINVCLDPNIIRWSRSSPFPCSEYLCWTLSNAVSCCCLVTSWLPAEQIFASKPPHWVYVLTKCCDYGLGKLTSLSQISGSNADHVSFQPHGLLFKSNNKYETVDQDIYCYIKGKKQPKNVREGQKPWIQAWN